MSMAAERLMTLAHETPSVSEMMPISDCYSSMRPLSPVGDRMPIGEATGLWHVSGVCPPQTGLVCVLYGDCGLGRRRKRDGACVLHVEGRCVSLRHKLLQPRDKGDGYCGERRISSDAERVPGSRRASLSPQTALAWKVAAGADSAALPGSARHVE